MNRARQVAAALQRGLARSIRRVCVCGAPDSAHLWRTGPDGRTFRGPAPVTGCKRYERGIRR